MIGPTATVTLDHQEERNNAMFVRTLLAAAVLSCTCLFGCGAGGDNDNEANKSEDEKDVAENANDKKKSAQDSESETNGSGKPFVAEEWAPDPGEGNPDAWKPGESKTGGSIFKALIKALPGDGEE